MNYEKLYNEALNRARKFYNSEECIVGMNPIDLELIFPELKENEDERIRKWLIVYFNQYIIDGMPMTFGNGLNVKDVISWCEKQSNTFTQKDVDNAYLKGISDAENERERQHKANYQIRKDIALFIYNYRGDIKDRAKWMNYLGINSFIDESKNEKLLVKTASETINEVQVDNVNKVVTEPRK